MHLGTDSNIMTELGFSINRYTLMATVQGVDTTLSYEVSRLLQQITDNRFLQIAYIIFELPSNLLLKWMTPHHMQARIFFTWGIATACGAATQTSTQLIVCRWFVG